MSFAEALAQHSTRKGPGCTMGTIEAALDKADLAALTAALADKTTAHTAIARALTAEGHKVNPDTVARHRRHECDCTRGPR